ncbi:MAG: FRG domain-containing protein [Sedimentisphaerales bacterium]|nr:FRG domain-containing protein [Sedimentisphaerales bacterium]
MCQNKIISSVDEFVQITKSDANSWDLLKSGYFPWFRGEPDCQTPLLPKLYRSKPQCGDYLENRLLQIFRQRAPILSAEYTLHREHIDQWLFLAQHVGLPTRLLDWTEGALIALYFALQEKKPVVWMLNPFDLNRLSESKPKVNREYNIYGLTWHDPGPTSVNTAQGNIAAAWGDWKKEVELPVAVPVTHIHPRMTAQRSCFTVHGSKDVSLYLLLGEIKVFDRIKTETDRNWRRNDILKKYDIEPTKRSEMLEHLRLLGISRVTLFPELDGLADDLTKLFRPDFD